MQPHPLCGTEMLMIRSAREMAALIMDAAKQERTPVMHQLTLAYEVGAFAEREGVHKPAPAPTPRCNCLATGRCAYPDCLDDANAEA